MSSKMCREILLVIGVQNGLTALCFQVMGNGQKRRPTGAKETQDHTDTTAYKTQLHNALLLWCTKEFGFRTGCNQTQEVGSDQPPLLFLVLTQSETEAQFLQ